MGGVLVRESYNWDDRQTDQDRSDLFSASQSRPGPDSSFRHADTGYQNQQEYINDDVVSETQFDDRDDLITASQITEDIFSRRETVDNKRPSHASELRINDN